MSAKKKGRPTKRKHAERDNREPLEDGFTPLMRQHAMNRLRVDPLNEEPLADCFASVILNRSTPEEDKFAGELFVGLLKKQDPAVVAQAFRRIMMLVSNAGMPHRNAFAFHAYCLFIEEAGREPSKPELRSYIEARRDRFTDAPCAEDKKGWDRLWKGSGLSDLRSR